MENKLAHLQMIQAVIARMASNSFLLKGWSVTLVAALFAVAAANADKNFVFLAYFPAIVFWALDGYFLWQERLFRKLYDKVRELEDDNIDFSMNTSGLEAGTWGDAGISPTLGLFHGGVIGSVFVFMLIEIFGK